MSNALNAPTVAAQQQRPFSVRQTLATIHLWLGIVFSLPFVALGLSGSILMIGHEIPGFGSDNAPSALAQPIVEILQAAQDAAPADHHPTMLAAPEHVGEPISVRFAPAGGGATTPGQQRRHVLVTVDPDTLNATLVPSQASSGGFMRLMHDLHGRLLISGGTGRQIVGWLGVFMCVLGLSGVVMWWPRSNSWKAWKAALTFKFGRSALKTNRDIHGAVGIWGLAVFMIVSFSGAYLGFPQQISGFLGAHPMVRDQRGTQVPNVVSREGQAPASADAVVNLAQSHIPGTALLSINWPARPNAPYRVNLVRPEDPNSGRISVYVDPWAGAVVETRDPSTLSGLDKFLMMQRGLHVGTAHGPIWWALVFLSGFLPLLFVVTGFSMWMMKRRNRNRVMKS